MNYIYSDMDDIGEMNFCKAEKKADGFIHRLFFVYFILALK